GGQRRGGKRRKGRRFARVLRRGSRSHAEHEGENRASGDRDEAEQEKAYRPEHRAFRCFLHGDHPPGDLLTVAGQHHLSTPVWGTVASHKRKEPDPEGPAPEGATFGRGARSSASRHCSTQLRR